jgi:drug/metabolite transporter (DMT)-like permease
MITKKSLAYIALVQLAFSAVDIYARNSLRAEPSFLNALTHQWFFVWLALHACIAPFQIRLITSHGIGRGVVLMNAFSVLYAVCGGYLLLNETISVKQGIAAVLVISGISLMLFEGLKQKTAQSRELFATPKGETHAHPTYEVIAITRGVRPGHVRRPAGVAFSVSRNTRTVG